MNFLIMLVKHPWYSNIRIVLIFAFYHLIVHEFERSKKQRTADFLSIASVFRTRESAMKPNDQPKKDLYGSKMS